MLLSTKRWPTCRESAAVVKSQGKVNHMLFFVNAAGEKEPPVIIGKSASPHCFKGLMDKANPHGLPHLKHG